MEGEGENEAEGNVLTPRGGVVVVWRRMVVSTWAGFSRFCQTSEGTKLNPGRGEKSQKGSLEEEG